MFIFGKAIKNNVTEQERAGLTLCKKVYAEQTFLNCMALTSFMSPISPVFHTLVTLSIGLKTQ